jgi:translocation and assembly module TamA
MLLGLKTDVVIELKDNTLLLKVLEEELSQQRSNNHLLKQYSKRNKIARYETQLLNERLRAEGYYDAQIKVEQQRGLTIYRIDPGPIYRVRDLLFQYPDHIDISETIVGIKSGDPLRAEAVLESKKALTTYVADNFCLYSIDVDYRVVVEHQTRMANVTFTVGDSPSVRFGDIDFIGLQSIDEDYLRDLLSIKKGDCFKPARLDAARLTLIQSNLLASVNAEVKQPDNNVVPIVLNVVERHHRSFTGGVGFESDEGFGVSAGWEHRNLMGRAQKLTINSYVAENAKNLSASLTQPHFRRFNQSITYFTNLESDDTDAFKSESGTLGAEISRQLQRHLRGSVGGELTFSEVEEGGVDDTYALLSSPLSLVYDSRNDVLDPRTGWVAALRVRPYWDAYDTGTKFLQSTVAASVYVTSDKLLWHPTLAIRSAIGATRGIDRDEVPANIRFYSGGGGSVRGYPFQTLGPLTDNEPDGGLSFVELSIETRLRWGERWGGVIFLDGGFAYEESLPQFDGDLLWGAGLGLRYYTGFVPIRVDIAIPLSKRDGIDDDYQLYISIGQAF